jgi:hypothetical protein
MVSCMVVHGSELARACMHRNALRALRALGCATASIWRGHGDADGLDHWQPLRGIDRGVLYEGSGEATGQAVVGGALPTLGCPLRAW